MLLERGDFLQSRPSPLLERRHPLLLRRKHERQHQVKVNPKREIELSCACNTDSTKLHLGYTFVHAHFDISSHFSSIAKENVGTMHFQERPTLFAPRSFCFVHSLPITSPLLILFCFYSSRLSFSFCSFISTSVLIRLSAFVTILSQQPSSLRQLVRHIFHFF